MIVLNDLDQGSDEWLLYRSGIPTASCFKKIITSKGTKSKSYQAYMNELIVERILGVQDGFKSEWMERGNELEDEATEAYETHTGLKTSKVGIILTDDLKVGISPDRVVYDGKKIVNALEIKCPAPTTFVKWRLDGRLPTEHFVQVQGQLWALNLKKMDFLYYHPGLGFDIIEVDRDDKFISRLEIALHDFVVELDEKTKVFMNGKV